MSYASVFFKSNPRDLTPEEDQLVLEQINPDMQQARKDYVHRDGMSDIIGAKWFPANSYCPQVSSTYKQQ